MVQGTGWKKTALMEQEFSILFAPPILINNRILKTSFVSRLRICELRQGFMDFV